MTNKNLSKGLIMLAAGIIIASVNTLNAQVLKINPKQFNMTISGTTNVHDFQTKVTQVSGEMTVADGKEIQSMVVEIPVRAIKSGEKLMDTKTYEAFKVDKHPNITFKLLEVNSLQISGNDVNVTVSGNLTMAGVTRKISLKATGKNTKTGVYQFNGTLNLKMTDFKMSPPTAMLGMMKVGDAITLKYEATFEGFQYTQN